MFKSIQFKILLIIAFLAIIMLAINGFFMVNKMEELVAEGISKEIVDIQIKEVKTIVILVIASFIIISFVIFLFASKKIISPISRLIKSANRIAIGEEVELKYKGDKKTEIDELVQAFETVTKRTKKQLK